LINIIINGDPHKVEANQDLYCLLENLGIDPSKVAVERNLEIVPRSTYQDVMIREGDKLEIVHFIGGGKSV
tara:strand:+ start:24360 stop:24572 length:213 start_codon:yes stop_codon:yes gene_type:complete